MSDVGVLSVFWAPAVNIELDGCYIREWADNNLFDLTFAADVDSLDSRNGPCEDDRESRYF